MTIVEMLNNGFFDNHVLSGTNHPAFVDNENSFDLNGLVEEARSTHGLSSEECWLYSCSKYGSPTNVPIGDWLRGVFEESDFPFCNSRYNLLSHLEFLSSNGTLSAYRFGGSVPSLNYLNPGNQRPSSAFPNPISNSLSTYRTIPNGQPSMGSSDSLSATVHQPHIDSAFFRQSHSRSSTLRYVRPKNGLPPHFSHSSQRLTSTPSNSNYHLSQSLANQSNRHWSGSAGKLGSFDTLDNIKADVQEIARIQEDNLKADVAALVAAAAGRHGSHNSLGSLGRCTPDGSLSRLTSAAGSPSASHSNLNQVESIHGPPSTQTANSHSHLTNSDTFDADREDSYPVDQLSSRSNHHGQLVSSSLDSAARRAYFMLPQKPTLPPSHIPYVGEANSFGFRPLRASIPTSTKPPVPSGLKRPSHIG